MNVLTNGVKVDVYAKDRCLVSLMGRMRTKSGKRFMNYFSMKMSGKVEWMKVEMKLQL